MKVAAFILQLVFASHVSAALQQFIADSFQNFSNLTLNAVVTDPTLNSGRIGSGGWINVAGSNSAYASLFGVTNLNLPLPWTVQVGGTNFSESGTVWSKSFLTNSGAASEGSGFNAPGGSGGSFSNLTVRWIMDLHSTNGTGTGVNFDLMAISGNDDCVCQLQTGNGLYRLTAHAVNGTNAGPFDLTPGFYAARLTRQQLPKTCLLEVWQWTGSVWNSMGAATGYFDFASTQFNSWWVRIQPNYLLNDSIVTGYHQWGAVALSYDAGDLIANNNIPRVNGQFRALRLSQ